MNKGDQTEVLTSIVSKMSKSEFEAFNCLLSKQIRNLDAIEDQKCSTRTKLKRILKKTIDKINN